MALADQAEVHSRKITKMLLDGTVKTYRRITFRQSFDLSFSSQEDKSKFNSALNLAKRSIQDAQKMLFTVVIKNLFTSSSEYVL